MYGKELNELYPAAIQDLVLSTQCSGTPSSCYFLVKPRQGGLQSLHPQKPTTTWRNKSRKEVTASRKVAWEAAVPMASATSRSAAQEAALPTTGASQQQAAEAPSSHSRAAAQQQGEALSGLRSWSLVPGSSQWDHTSLMTRHWRTGCSSRSSWRLSRARARGSHLGAAAAARCPLLGRIWELWPPGPFVSELVAGLFSFGCLFVLIFSAY